MGAISRCLWLINVLRSTSAQSTGHESCPCLSSARPAIDSYIGTENDTNGAECVVPLYDGEQSYCYPLDYGGSGCKTYDEALPPACINAWGAPARDRPSWCMDEWCWVDAKKCSTDYIYVATASEALSVLQGLFPYLVHAWRAMRPLNSMDSL
eukprot:TRINITY_DN15360_c0_g1_i2.p2 TRINITY_DN15360_c0_g1~~TRINITY_DN15360_c0_g1_i2.p2  ORF type:complete len:153 (-),score=1.63 TRINITY_DN15360_c0_g1_i2:350-808(-)